MPQLFPEPFRFGQKLTLILLLACIAGFAWAMSDRRPWEKKDKTPPVVRDEPAEQEPPPPGKKEKEQDPEPLPEPEEPSETPPTPAGMTDKQLDSLFQSVRQMISKAEYDAAAEELGKVEEIQIAEKGRRNALRGWKSRIRIYQDLIRETQLERIITMPEVTRLELKNGRTLLCRSLMQEESVFTIETVQGIRSRINKNEITRIKELDLIEAFWEIWDRLKSISAPWGIEAREIKIKTGHVFRFNTVEGRSVSGEKFFSLADFCVSNGANRLVTPLLDEALKRDRNLLQKVHEKKGERLVSLLFYFLTVHAPTDAEYLLRKVLLPHYSDTRAFRVKITDDPESVTLLSRILKKPLELKTEEEIPTPEKIRLPETRPATKIKLPQTTPDKIKNVVLQGDKFYKTAMNHLLRSDPNKHPENWGEENIKALEFFRKAASAYSIAQETYSETAKIPQALLDRYRETQIRMSLCRKRAVSTR